jgi:hypothetical protein
LNDANERARTELRTFFQQMGFERVEFGEKSGFTPLTPSPPNVS